MKIAVVSDDGTNISQHFGRARQYVVLAVEEGNVVSREKRNKVGHHTLGNDECCEAASGERHGFDAGAQSRHVGMAEGIADCQTLIAGGMGWGAYKSLKDRGIDVVVTNVENIEDAVRLYLDGKLPNIMQRLH